MAELVLPINLGQITACRDIVGKSFNQNAYIYRTLLPGISNDVAITSDFLNWGSSETLDKKAQVNNYVGNHPNLLGITTQGLVHNDVRYFYVVFPLMTGSLRSLMFGQTLTGLPEDYIVTALKETVIGLEALHKKGYTHGQITPGHVFFNEREIKLGFSATVFDFHEGQRKSTGFSLNMKNVCYWGSAPEIYERHDGEQAYESDIWQIGITALELAYGRFKFTKREDLIDFVSIIHEKRRLPDKEEFEGKLWKTECYTRVFSEEFERMVIKCLSFKPEERPSAEQLLECPIFLAKNIRRVGEIYSFWFRNHIVGLPGKQVGTVAIKILQDIMRGVTLQ